MTKNHKYWSSTWLHCCFFYVCA